MPVERGSPLQDTTLLRRVVIVVPTRTVVVMLFFRGRLGLLVADMKHAAIIVFIDAIEPTAAQRLIVKGVVIIIVAENPARAEAVANQRSGIFLFAGRDLY